MCGIIGFTGSGSATPILLEGLSKLEYRGYDSAGIALLQKNKITIKKTAGRVEQLTRAVCGDAALFGTTGIGHTRWATHGEATEKNAHPHISFDRKFCLVHNGIIENCDSLARELKEDGITFYSDTDTEIIPNLIAKYFKGDFPAAVLSAVKRLKGAFALCILCADFPDTIVAVRQFSPLMVGLKTEQKLIASDIGALLGHADQTVMLSDGEIAVLNPDSVRFYDFEGNELEKKPEKINIESEEVGKGDFAHFMLKEIFEQPEAVQKTINCRIRDGKVFFEGLKLSKEKLSQVNKINIIACGSAYHAGVVGEYIFEEILGIPSKAEVASEYRYRRRPVDKNTLTVVISQSGETADTLAALQDAKKKGSHVLSVVNVVSSSIARASDDVLYTQAGPEIAVATTKGYITQLAELYLFCIWAAEGLNRLPKEEIKRLTAGLLSMPEAITKCLTLKDETARMAKAFCGKESMFFIGRNMDFAVSLEASLKLKEISYIHSEAYPAGELKHGTISLIDQGTVVIALCSYEPLWEKMLSSIREVKARGAYVIVCTTEENEMFSALADETLLIPKTDPALCPFAEIIPFQLLAYFVSTERGCDVDKPRNLAKSVTVE
jgi:glucosamine--fructose-6-phosphate aminotransferase (isomerizing)